MQPWKEIVDREGLSIIGSTKVQLSRSDCRVAECNIGSFFADAFVFSMIAETDAGDWTYSPIALILVTEIRATLAVGDLTYDDLVNALPFVTMLDTMDLLGEHLLLALEHSVSRSREADYFEAANALQFSGLFFFNLHQILQIGNLYFYIIGLRVVFDTTRPSGNRVVSVDVLCRKCAVPEYESLDPKEVYRIVVGSFIASGRDGFDVFPKYGFNHRNGTLVDVDAVAQYVKRLSPIVSGKDGRLTIIT